ncbi:type II secretion system F family protein [Chitinophaga flava]|nr:type II secretion system F family protein [Chitinophaga flava]
MAGLDINKLKTPARTAAAPTGETKEPSVPWWQKDIQLGSGMSDKIKADFFLQLYTLTEAGVDIRSSLELIVNQQKKKKVRAIFQKIYEDIIGGMSISQSMRAQSCFTDYEVLSIGIGEETGRLAIVFKDLYSFFDRKIKQRRQMVGALTYPMIVVVVAIGAIGFMANFIVPMFADVFKRLGNRDLPAITQLVVSISDGLKKTAWLWMLGFAATAYTGWKYRKATWFKQYSSRLILKMPVVGSLTLKIHLARMCNSMALLISSRVPVLQAIQLVSQMIQFHPVQTALKEVETGILSGKSLHGCMQQFDIFPPKLIALIKVGEEVNKLGDFFERVNGQLNDEIMHETALIGNFMEPLIIIFLGLVVGVILIAMYLPLFTMGQTF